jgi:hypothetical protein
MASIPIHLQDQGEPHMSQMTRQHLIALVVLLQMLVAANVVASLDNTASPTVAKVVAKTTLPIEYTDTPQAAPPAIVVQPDKETKNILKNNVSMLWVAGGAVLGAYVCTVLRKAFNFTDGPNTFGVAMATSVPLSAFALHQWFDNRAEYCFLGGWSFALLSWGLLEIILVLANRWKTTAAEKGLAGLKAEMTGQATVTPNQPVITTMPTMPALPPVTEPPKS